MVDLKLLVETIDRSGLKRSYIAEEIGLTREGLWNKLSGKTEFTASEMSGLKRVLSLSNARFRRIFFATERELNSHTKGETE